MFCSFGGRIPYHNCGRAQMSTTSIFRTVQNSVLLVYIFRIFFLIGGLISLWSCGFTIFQIGYPNDCYQILSKYLGRQEKEEKIILKKLILNRDRLVLSILA